jgi:hypothetical protein
MGYRALVPRIGPEEHPYVVERLPGSVADLRAWYGEPTHPHDGRLQAMLNALLASDDGQVSRDRYLRDRFGWDGDDADVLTDAEGLCELLSRDGRLDIRFVRGNKWGEQPHAPMSAHELNNDYLGTEPHAMRFVVRRAPWHVLAAVQNKVKRVRRDIWRMETRGLALSPRLRAAARRRARDVRTRGLHGTDPNAAARQNAVATALGYAKPAIDAGRAMAIGDNEDPRRRARGPAVGGTGARRPRPPPRRARPLRGGAGVIARSTMLRACANR